MAQLDYLWKNTNILEMETDERVETLVACSSGVINFGKKQPRKQTML